jgi:hypothetical protein
MLWESATLSFGIIYEMQMKRNNEKIARRKISFPTYKTLLFFLLFGPPLLSEL